VQHRNAGGDAEHVDVLPVDVESDVQDWMTVVASNCAADESGGNIATRNAIVKPLILNGIRGRSV
jgi:hypothetical protein